MAVPIPIGFEFLDETIDDKCYYIDKTKLLYKLLSDNKTKVSRIISMCYFGKSLYMSIIECCLNICRDSQVLFKGLAISKY